MLSVKEVGRAGAVWREVGIVHEVRFAPNAGGADVFDQAVREVAPVFESAGQAVHVAFIVLAQEAQQDAPLRKALIRAMESIQLSAEQQDWLNELRGTRSGTIDFGGMDSTQIRAQCALVEHAVRTKLPKTEMWVLQAKHGQTDFEDIEDGQCPALHPPRRRFAFSLERINAIKGLSEWFKPMFPRMSGLALDCLLGRMFANHKKLEISARDLAATFGGNHTYYLRATKKIKTHIHALETLAYERLDEYFTRQGLVGIPHKSTNL
jgi:hypothetical protein